MPTDPAAAPLCRPWPEPVLALCAALEESGIPAWLQGEALLDAWLGSNPGRRAAPALVCLATPERLLAAQPAAIVTAESARRLTRATAAGPVDLIPGGERPIEAVLAGFGLAPLALAFRPGRADRPGAGWCDPGGARERIAKGGLPLVPAFGNPFRAAPRRYWIAAQLIAEHALEPAPELVAAAREALPEVLPQLPEGAPARRALERILISPAPAPALAFLRESGVVPSVLPGLEPANESRLAALPPLPALRWAAYLRGDGAARALVRLRMPTGRARRIHRLLEAHPLERSVDPARDAGVRRVVARLTAFELDGLIVWRSTELGSAASNTAARDRLAKVERAIARVRAQEEATRSVRALALGGADVMRLLGTGPGPHVGRALAHLARFAAERPEHDAPERLAAELQAWWAARADRGA